MIEFGCKNCGLKVNVQDQFSGKRVKCPKCGSVGFVPDNSVKIKFDCKNCGQIINVPQIHAGKKGKCPRCKNPVVVPSLKKEPADGARTVSVKCSMCNKTIQLPETSIGKTIECPECSSYVETSSGAVPYESDASADDNLYEEETEEYEDSESVDRHLIFVISSVAGVVVVVLVILVVILPFIFRFSRSRPAGRPQELRDQPQVADTDSRPQPVTSDTQPEEPVSLEDKLYEQSKIAFVSSRDGNHEIYAINIDGSGQKRLTDNFADDKCPSWSPDGEKIIFQSDRDGNNAIYVMNADGSEQKRLTSEGSNTGPSWSPDGKRIAFVSSNVTFEIYVMNIDGSGRRCLTDHTRAFHDGANLVLLGPCWSPDGKKIVFTS
ncbi:MAG: TolB family protein, partial [Planctomycetota bacterium]